MQVTTRWKNFFTSPTCIVLLLLFIAFLAPEKKKKDGKKEKKRNMSAAAAALAPLATGRLGWSQTKYCSNWFGPTDSYAAGERRGGERRQLSCCNCCCLIPFKSMGGWRERETIVVRSSHQFVPSMYYGMYNTVRTQVREPHIRTRRNTLHFFLNAYCMYLQMQFHYKVCTLFRFCLWAETVWARAAGKHLYSWEYLILFLLSLSAFVGKKKVNYVMLFVVLS